MDKHLICIDLDNTLLDDKKRISEFNKEILKSVRELGHEVIITTGRAHYRSQMFYEELNLNSLMVNRNAAHIHAPFDKDYTNYVEWLDSKTVQELLNSEMIELMEEMYIENLNNVYVLKGTKDFYLSYPICNVVDYKKQELNNCSNLITISTTNKNINKVLKMLEKYPIKCETFPFSNNLNIIQVYPLKSDKTIAFKHLSEYYDVPVERIIALGDGPNDVNMIKDAGIGVAMKNAIDEVKQNAKMVTNWTNNESGVGYFLKEYFNI